MSALNNEYSVLEQDPHPQGPLYSLLVKLILSPNYFNARELYWYLVETNANPFTPLTNDQVMLRDSLYFLMEILQYDRNLNTSNPLWLLVLRQVQFLAQPPKSMPVKLTCVQRLRHTVGRVEVGLDVANLELARKVEGSDVMKLDFDVVLSRKAVVEDNWIAP